MKILITGASRGIGHYLLQKIKDEDFDVCGTYNKTMPEDDLIRYFQRVDIRDDDQVKKWIESNVNSSERIVLINCAGTNFNALAHKTDSDKFLELLNVNLVGTFRMIHAVLPFMREKGFGRIINFSSVVAEKGVPGTSAYAASKSALWGMTKAIAVENAEKGITINNLNLGYFDIGLISEVPGPMLEGIKKTIPVQQLGQPENILNAVKFLIKSDYISGTALDINGGLY